MKTVLVIAAAVVACASATLRGTSSSANKLVAWGTGSDSDNLAADGSLRPEIVAQLLGQVGMSWVHDRFEAMEEHISDATALAHITESCVKVVSAIVQGASGNRHKVQEYMGFVCEKSHQKPLCQNFTKDMSAFMVGDLMYNRQELNYTNFCGKLYNGTLVGAAKDEKVRLEKAWEEHLKADEAEQKRREEEMQAQEKKNQALEEWRKAEKAKAEQEREAMRLLREAEEAKAEAESKAAVAELASKTVAQKGAFKLVSHTNFNATKNTTNASEVLAKAEAVIAAVAKKGAGANATAVDNTSSTSAVANATAANATRPNATKANTTKVAQ